jgi:hypothetical protein
MNKAFPELSQALSQLLDQMDESIRKSGYEGTPIQMYLAGGMAVNFYCGTRYTEDVDAIFSHRLLPGKFSVNYVQKNGAPTFLYLDNNYNPTFGLLHEHFDRDAVEWTGIGNEKRKIRLNVLAPVDLAVTKVSRYSEQDREDILALAKERLFTADQFRYRATEAMRDFVGDLSPVKISVDLLFKSISLEMQKQLELERRQPSAPTRTMERGGIEPDFD